VGAGVVGWWCLVCCWRRLLLFCALLFSVAIVLSFRIVCGFLRCSTVSAAVPVGMLIGQRFVPALRRGSLRLRVGVVWWSWGGVLAMGLCHGGWARCGGGGPSLLAGLPTVWPGWVDLPDSADSRVIAGYRPDVLLVLGWWPWFLRVWRGLRGCVLAGCRCRDLRKGLGGGWRPVGLLRSACRLLCVLCSLTRWSFDCRGAPRGLADESVAGVFNA